jgi:hypothetical protein
MRVYSPDHAPDVMVRDFYGRSPLLIDVKLLVAEGDVAAARVARTLQGAHLRKHEHTVRNLHQYNSLQNVRARLCVFAIDLRRGSGLGASYTNVISTACYARRALVRLVGAVGGPAHYLRAARH